LIQDCLSEGGSIESGDLTDEQWRISIHCSPIGENAVQRSRASGARSTAFSGFCAPARRGARHAGAIRQLELSLRTVHPLEQARWWDAAFETLARPPADEEHAIDSTIVRAHQHAAGVKRMARPVGKWFFALA
jgi:hypothetical protein